jgi:hypothetical protein
MLYHGVSLIDKCVLDDKIVSIDLAVRKIGLVFC